MATQSAQESTPASSPAPPAGPVRRGFLRIVTVACAGLVAALAAVPGLGFLLAPAARDDDGGAVSVRVASLRTLPPGLPVRAEVVATRRDAWNRFDRQRLGAVWLVRSPDGSSVTAFSAVCPHLGCAIDFAGPAAGFRCPCHDSRFSIDGARTGGPAPRGMDTLPVVVDGDDVRVTWQRFRQGALRKENA